MFTKSVYESVEKTLNKERRGIVKSAQIELAMSLAYDELLIELIKEFKETGTLPAGLQGHVKTLDCDWSSGPQVKPTDFAEAVSCIAPMTVGEVTTSRLVDVIKNDREWVDRITSKIAPPSAEYPILRVNGANIERLPDAVTTATMYYIEHPASWFTLAYTTTARTKAIDEGNSTDNVKFNNALIPVAVAKTLVYMDGMIGITKEQ